MGVLPNPPNPALWAAAGLTSLFDLGLDFWWYDENWGGIIPGLTFGSGSVDHLVWGQEIFRSVLSHYNELNGPRNKVRPPVLAQGNPSLAC